MSEPQPSKGAETNAGHKPASGALESLSAAGARLGQLRSEKGWSIDDVSSRLKVAAPKLRALEAGDIGQMPGVAFALGVVRSYARMLGVDPEPFVQALRRERGAPEVDLSMPASTGTDLPRGRVSISLSGSPHHRSWLWAVAAAVIAVIAIAMWRTGGESSHWLARFKTGSAAGASAVQPASDAGASVAAAPIRAFEASAASAAQPASADAASGASALPATAASGAPVAASPAEPASSGGAVAAASGAASAVVPAAGQSVVSLMVKQDCWFSVRDKNGKEIYSGLVKAGSTQAVAGDAPLRLTIGNKAGLETLSFDGKPVDPAKYAAARGNVARFALP